ncbi:AbrB/MazE/SpoVT family DNA-binding domain-containing protein [Candidatus Daviesbacteria bacterium]|nr:AbrB/MazE/SpoVT family DNA-binding domain-containing protein [Candidatus Daviesbacteria bacterium]
MQMATVGTKYQVVIPKEVRKKIKGLEPGSKLMIQLNEETITLKPIKQNWSDKNYGAFKRYWKGVDPIAEVEKMKEEWEERLEKQAKIWNEK